MALTPKAKTIATQEHVALKRAVAASKRMHKAVKKGHMLHGPKPRRLKIRA